MTRNTQNTQAAQLEALRKQLEEAQAAAAQAQAEAEQARAEAEAAKASRKRTQRVTPKQRRFLEYLTANPESDVATACREAGATETSHGFVFRMIEHGYLRITVAEGVLSQPEGDQPEGEDAPTDESDESGESETSEESVESESAPAA